MPTELLPPNLAASRLASAVDADDATFALATGEGARFGTIGVGEAIRANVQDEVVVVTARSGDSLTVTRGAEGTTAVAHPAGALVAAVLTKAGLEAYFEAEVAAAVAAEATLARNADNLTSGTVADARIASTIARDSEVAAAVSAHVAATEAYSIVIVPDTQNLVPNHLGHFDALHDDATREAITSYLTDKWGGMAQTGGLT